MSEPLIHILAIESSCDDTSVALLRARNGEDLPQLISWSVQSQNDIHEKFGGVVPELASRAHLQNLLPCLSKVLSNAGMRLEEVDAFAATHQPGLVGCLLIGHTTAKTLSFLFDRPLLSCHHIEAHLMSVYLDSRPKFPYLAAVVSGGHTSLYSVSSFEEIEVVGVTLDDAMGEAFDKGAKLLGLGFPGGPELDALSQTGDPLAFKFGRVKVPDLNFSFSGLKSELQRLVKREPEAKREDIAASYQAALVNHLIEKIETALQSLKLNRLVLVGGVARNSEIRSRLQSMCERGTIESWMAPSPEFCTDNAAMVGVLAWRKFLRKEFSSFDTDVISTSRPIRGRRA